MIIDKTYTLVSCKGGCLEIRRDSLLGDVYVGYIIPEECLGIFGFYSFLNVIASVEKQIADLKFKGAFQ